MSEAARRARTTGAAWRRSRRRRCPSRSANADLRREPALERHIDIAPTPRTAPANEFELDEPDPDGDAARQATVRRQMQRVARQASLDPEDGIEL